jgi:tetratricopeptide (TPR) repeat protein
MAMKRAAAVCGTAVALGTVALAGQAGRAPRQDGAQQADAAFRAGYAAHRAGQIEAARKDFAEVVKLAPQIAEGHEALGNVLLEMGKAQAAAAELETAARLKPNDVGIESDLALAYVQTGEAGKAIPHFAKAEAAADAAAQAGPSQTDQGQLDAVFHDAYARALAGVGRLSDAVTEFSEEEKLAGPTADVDDAIGTVEAQMGKWDEAKTSFQRAVDESPFDIPKRLHLAILLRTQHDVAGALAVMEPKVPLERSYTAEAWAEYGRDLAAAGQDETAVLEFEEALKLDPKVAGAAADLAMALQRLGRQQEAVPLFEQALAAEPENVDVLTNLGLALTLTGKAKEALPYFERAAAKLPKDVTILKDRGVAHIQLSAFDEAIKDFEAALALDPGDSQLHYDLGLAYKFKDRPEDAIKELSRAGEMDPTLQDPPYTLGILYMQLGKLDEAIAELKKAAALRPNDGNTWAILGSTLKQASRLEEARAALEKAIPLQPGQPGPRVTLAGVLAEEAADLSSQADAADAAGDQAKANALRAQMKELRSKAADYRREGADLSRAAVNRQRSTFALNAGNQLLLRGQIAEAVSRYQEAIAADGTFAEPHRQMAIALDRQGRGQDATAEREKARELEK